MKTGFILLLVSMAVTGLLGIYLSPIIKNDKYKKQTRNSLIALLFLTIDIPFIISAYLMRAEMDYVVECFVVVILINLIIVDNFLKEKLTKVLDGGSDESRRKYKIIASVLAAILVIVMFFLRRTYPQMASGYGKAVFSIGGLIVLMFAMKGRNKTNKNQ